jgi:hypothetical protein
MLAVVSAALALAFGTLSACLGTKRYQWGRLRGESTILIAHSNARFSPQRTR